MSLVRITLPEELYMGLVASSEVPTCLFGRVEFHLSLFGEIYLSLVGSFSLWSTQVLLPMVIL